MELGIAEVDGFQIGYRQSGDGPPLVLLHGAWSDGREWRLQLESLSDEFTVVAWDAPGCGRSSDPPERFSLADYADAVAGLVGSLDLDRPHLLGLSFGGSLAIEVAHRHPAAVRSLILVSAYAGWAGSLSPEVIEARVAKVLAEADQPPETWVRSYLPGFFAGPVAPELEEEMLGIMLDVRPAGILPMIHAMAAADLRPVLGDVAVPTLLLYGELDSRAPLAVAHEIERAVPGAQLAVIPGVGHVVNLEAPAIFDREVRRFLHGVRP